MDGRKTAQDLLHNGNDKEISLPLLLRLRPVCQAVNTSLPTSYILLQIEFAIFHIDEYVPREFSGVQNEDHVRMSLSAARLVIYYVAHLFIAIMDNLPRKALPKVNCKPLLGGEGGLRCQLL